MARVVGFFRSIYRAQRTEALVLLLWAGEGFDLFVPDQRVSPASVRHTLDEAELPAGSRVVGSIHSHGAFGAWASSVDEDDEAEFDGLHVIVGGGGGGSWQYVARDGGTDWTQKTTLELRHPRLLRLLGPLIRRQLRDGMRAGMARAKAILEARATG